MDVLPRSKFIIDFYKELRLEGEMSIAINGVDVTSAEMDIVEEHIHSVQQVAPSTAIGILVTAGAAPWDLGAESGTILTGPAAWFDIHYIDIETISANGNYQLNIYANSVIKASVTFTKKSVTADDYVRCPVITPLLAAGSVITAKLGSLAGGAETCRVKVWYHQYA